MYSKFAALLLNTVIAFTLLNLALAPFYPVELTEQATVTDWYEGKRWLDKFSDEQLEQVYPGLTRSEAERVISETAVLESDYEPFVEFKSKAVTSKYLNVSDIGFRSNGPGQAPWPPKEDAFSVFVFGGSTTFGDGIADADSIPAHIQKLMPKAEVYNFGVGAYFSTQERLRFEQLIYAGHVPKLAIFVDGLNEFIMIKGETALTPLLRNATKMMNEYEHRRDLAYGFERVIKALPIWRAVQPVNKPQIFAHNFSSEALMDQVPINAAIDRYLTNKKMIEAVAKQYGVQTIFVWQPIPFYRYPGEKLMVDILGLMPPGSEQAIRPKYGYPIAEKRLRHDVKWCADIQEGRRDVLDVDHVHYSGPMSSLVAECAISEIAGRQ